MRVFRDEATLSMSEDLWALLRAKLDTSSFLLILASPASAKSPWVEREISYFLQSHSRTRVGIVITSGKNPWNGNEWNAGRADLKDHACAVSPEVFAAFGSRENPPLFVDLRPYRNVVEAAGRPMARRLKLFASGIPKPVIGATMSIAAAIKGCDKDEIFGSHMHRERRVRIGLSGAVLVFLVLAVLALYAANAANLQLFRSRMEAGRTSLMNGRPLNAAVYLSEASNTSPFGSNPFQPVLRLLLGRAMRTVDASEAVFVTGAPVNVAALSHEADFGFTGDANGRVGVWSMKTGGRVRSWVAHEGEVRALALSRDGQLLATGGTDKLAKIWDVRTGKLKASLDSHVGTVSALAFASSGAWLATAMGQYFPGDDSKRDPKACLWSVATGKRVREFELPLAPSTRRDQRSISQQVTGIAFSPDGSAIAAVGDGVFGLWEVETGRRITLAFDDTKEQPVVGFDPKGEFIVTAGLAEQTEGVTASSGPSLRDARTGKMIARLNGNGGLRSLVAFDPTGERFATSGPQNDATIWRIDRRGLANPRDARFGAHRQVLLKGHSMAVTDVSFAMEGAVAITSSLDRTVRVWDADTGALLAIFEGHDDAVEQVQVSVDSHWILSASLDGSARLWDGTKTELAVLRHPDAEPIFQAAFSPDGTRLLAVPLKGAARLWDLTTRRSLCEVPVSTTGSNAESFGAVAFSKSRARPLIGTWRADGEVALWNGTNCGRVRVLDRTQPHKEGDPDRRLMFDAVSGHLIGASESGAALVWQEDGGRPKRLEHGEPISWAELSTDGRSAVTAGDNGEVKLWDVVGDRPPRTWKAHQNSVLEARFRPGRGDLLVTLGENDHDAKLWNVSSGALYAALPLRGDGYTASFSSDGSLLTVGTVDGRASVWEIKTRMQRASIDDLQGIVLSSSFVGESRFVVSSTLGGRVVLWDASSGVTLEDLTVPTGQAIMAQSSPRGDLIALPGFVPGGNLLLLMTPLEARSPADIRTMVECRGRRRLEAERPVLFDSGRCR